MKMEKGWRQLRPDEVLMKRDEFFDKVARYWGETGYAGRKVKDVTSELPHLRLIYRRRIKGASRKGAK